MVTLILIFLFVGFFLLRKLNRLNACRWIEWRKYWRDKIRMNWSEIHFLLFKQFGVYFIYFWSIFSHPFLYFFNTESHSCLIVNRRTYDWTNKICIKVDQSLVSTILLVWSWDWTVIGSYIAVTFGGIWSCDFVLLTPSRRIPWTTTETYSFIHNCSFLFHWLNSTRWVILLWRISGRGEIVDDIEIICDCSSMMMEMVMNNWWTVFICLLIPSWSSQKSSLSIFIDLFHFINNFFIVLRSTAWTCCFLSSYHIVSYYSISNVFINYAIWRRNCCNRSFCWLTSCFSCICWHSSDCDTVHPRITIEFRRRRSVFWIYLEYIFE